MTEHIAIAKARRGKGLRARAAQLRKQALAADHSRGRQRARDLTRGRYATEA